MAGNVPFSLGSFENLEGKAVTHMDLALWGFEPHPYVPLASLIPLSCVTYSDEDKTPEVKE